MLGIKLSKTDLVREKLEVPVADMNAGQAERDVRIARRLSGSGLVRENALFTKATSIYSRARRREFTRSSSII
ncbi:hypothetical protein [Leptolyngbya sp. 7M]|uniref:hypothetical protein n=1 Tax=Leptolyngbya sp. 7M TaxID=2812896 RepID=UPI001B8CDF3A|nr:hypothetical protein [Leptolyngbya sp. 7M]QYO67188.1 hypothetical protein JVX88_10520 [Leptolyngbya sp. 7M]